MARRKPVVDATRNSKALQLSKVLLESLDTSSDADDLARRAWLSRSGFYRLFQALIEETPGSMRRRLLLERAAWQLKDSDLSVTEIALDAGYGSLEAFTRAFRRAFGQSPSLYRRTRCGSIHLAAPNNFHFQPSTIHLKGEGNDMDLFDIFAGTDSWYTRRLLEHAMSLTDEQLDRPVKGTAKVFAWDKPDRNLREILERMVQTKEVWTAALTAGDMPKLDAAPAEERAPAAMLDRFERADRQFYSVVKDVRDRGAWSESFVDALCEPPETFSYGGMFAHVITFNSVRRLSALDAFHQLGVNIKGSGCPMDYEASLCKDGEEQ
jgi:AraC family transcriptional regulator